jgi:hypothetical protein
MEGLSFSCPVCGSDVPRHAKSCPECGACEKSGWSEDRYLDGLDLPDYDLTDGRPIERSSGRSGSQTLRQRLWLVVAIILLIAMLWLTLRGAW